MPELPDVQLYLEALEERLSGEQIVAWELRNPFLVRSYEPRLDEVLPCRILEFSRIGKRIVWHLEGDLYFLFHLMIAGRFHWRKAGHQTAQEIRSAGFAFRRTRHTHGNGGRQQKTGIPAHRKWKERSG